MNCWWENGHVRTFVYGLFDPRTNRFFYVGITKNPHYRFASHRNDKCSSARSTIRSIEAAGAKCELKILAISEERGGALAIEHHFICNLPGLVNRDANKRIRK